MKNDLSIEQKNEQELEEAKRKQRNNIKLRAACIVWFAAGLGCLFGGMFSGTNWLVITGLGIMFGGALLLSVVVIGAAYVRSAKKDLEKHGGSPKPYIYKGVTLAIAISSAVAFGVCGFVLNELLFIGTIVSFFAFVVIFFAWQP